MKRPEKESACSLIMVVCRATAIIDGKEETSYSLFVTVNVPEQTTLSYLVIIIVLIIILAIAAIAVYRKKLKS